MHLMQLTIMKKITNSRNGNHFNSKYWQDWKYFFPNTSTLRSEADRHTNRRLRTTAANSETALRASARNTDPHRIAARVHYFFYSQIVRLCVGYILAENRGCGAERAKNSAAARSGQVAKVTLFGFIAPLPLTTSSPSSKACDVESQLHLGPR